MTPPRQLRELINEHIPSLTPEDEDAILERLSDFDAGDGEADVGDFALRTCACGKAIDGFYDYAEHLIAIAGDLWLFEERS
jgi:hypothetical protein